MYGARAQEYTTLQQRLGTLQQTLTMAQHRLEIEHQSVSQRLTETEEKISVCAAILQETPRITQAYAALQEARQRDAEMAQALQQRYGLEQEKSQVERGIQQKRHALELEQRSLLDRQQDWQDKEAALPVWQRQTEDLRLQLLEVEQQAKHLEQIRATGVALRVQLESSIPQLQETLQKEIHEQEEKRSLLETARAQCPLCEKALTDQERRRVVQKLAQEIARHERRMRELRDEQQRLQEQRQNLRAEYRQLEQQLEQRRGLEQQYAAAQASFEEATRARDNLAAVLQALQDLDARLTAGSYAAAELAHLQQLTAALERLSYDQQAHASVKHTLLKLAEAELQQARLQQAEADLVLLHSQRQDLGQQVARLEQTLQTRQFAVAEQLELQEVTERLARLDFDPATYNALRQQLQEHQYAERQYVQLETARTHLAEERVVAQSLEAKKQRVEMDVAALQHEHHQFADGIGALETVRAEVRRAEALERTLREREGETRVALGRSQSHYEHCLQREIELEHKQQQYQQAVAERTLYGDLVQIFGKNGIQAIIIENAIPELEEAANRILARVTNNAMHLTLETQRDTKTAGVAETLEIKISDALGTRNYELFSGGEAFRINLALRIALSKMLAQRAGARLRTLVIDEGFGTQDPQGLERLVEVIKTIQDDFAKIIVITHLRELKNAFETHIEVKKDPLRGSFYQVL
jgi:exonuclease SbcC